MYLIYLIRITSISILNTPITRFRFIDLDAAAVFVPVAYLDKFTKTVSDTVFYTINAV